MIILTLIFSWFDWQVIKTKNYTVIYKPGYEYGAIQTLNNLEYYRPYIDRITGNNSGNLPVVIEDTGILSNGFANPFFYNIHIFTYPPKPDYYLEGIEDWYRLVGLHEYTHIAHMTKTAGISKILTRIFGAPYQSNMYSPGWIIEGITVYTESQISPYEGRLNDGFFDNYLETRIREKKYPDIIEATNEPLSFPYGKFYLFGGEFLDYLSYKYGEEKITRFFTVYGSYPWALISAFFPVFGIDLASKKVYGKTLPRLFSEWQRYEMGRPIDYQSPGERLTKNGWYISSVVYHKNKLYYSREIPIKLDGYRYKSFTYIMEFNLADKKEKIFTTLNSPLTTKMRLYGDNLYLCNAEIRRAENVYYNRFGITSVLKRMNLTSKKTEVLFKDDIRAFCVLNDSIILYVKVKDKSPGSEIWLYIPEMRKRLWEGDFLINDIETNGKWIALSAGKGFENTDLYLLDLETNEFILLLKTPWTEGNLFFIKEDLLGYIANYDGEQRIYSIDLNQPENIFRYTKTGFVNSFCVNDSVIFCTSLNSEGFDIYTMVAGPENYRLKEWKASLEPNFDSLNFVIKRGNYLDITKTILPSARIPLFLPMDSTFKKWLYSAIFAGADATNEHFYIMIIGYDQLENIPYFQMDFQSLFFNPLNFGFFYYYNDLVYLSFNYPIFYSRDKKIKNISSGLHFTSFDGYKRKEIKLEASITGGNPYTTFSSDFSVPFERKVFKSSIDRTGFSCSAGLYHMVFNGEFRIKLTGFSDTQNPDTSLISIRGYEDIHSQSGIIFKTEYSHRLLNIRRGLWNPNIYFEDLFGRLFIDYAIDREQNRYYSTGFELGIETKVGFGFIKIFPQAGIAINKNKKIKMFITINASSFVL